LLGSSRLVVGLLMRFLMGDLVDGVILVGMFVCWISWLFFRLNRLIVMWCGCSCLGVC